MLELEVNQKERSHLRFQRVRKHGGVFHKLSQYV